MARARQKTFVLALVSVVGIGIGFAGNAPAAAPPPAKAVAAPFSPSGVLAQIGNRTGNMSYASFGQPGERPDNDRSLAPYLTVLGAGGPEATERVPLKETTRGRVDRRRHRARAGAPAVREHRARSHRGGVRVPGVDARRGARRAHEDRRSASSRRRSIAARRRARATRRRAREGKRASLLEQERPNVFTMNVANIMPGDRIAVEMDYSEMLVPEEATYEFVYPTVVGPRYTGGADPAKDKWMANPHLPAGAPEPYEFDIEVHLETGIALKELSSPSHQIDGDLRVGQRAPTCKLAIPGGGNRDFVLRYRLAGDKIESGLLLWQGEGGRRPSENFFALMMEPPRRPTAAQIPAREYIFLLDVSGSMHGFPLDTAKALMRNLLAQLRPTDTSTSCCSRAPRTYAARRDRSRRARTRSPTPIADIEQRARRAAAPS